MANGLLVSHTAQRRGDLALARGQPDGAVPDDGRLTASSRPRYRRDSGGLPMYDAVDPQTRRLRGRAAEPGARLPASRARGRDRRRSSPAFTATTRSRPAAGSSTGRPTSATRSSPRRKPNYDRIPDRVDRGPRDLPPVVRRRGDARRPGRTSGSTRASRPSRSGSTPSATAAPTAQERFDEHYTTPERPSTRARTLVPGPRRAPRPEPALPYPGLRPRRDDAAGAAREGR